MIKQRKLKDKIYRNLSKMPLNQFWEVNSKPGAVAYWHPENPCLQLLVYPTYLYQEQGVSATTILVFDTTDAKNNNMVNVLAPPTSFLYWNPMGTLPVHRLVTSYFHNGEMHFADEWGFDTARTRKAKELWEANHAAKHDWSWFSTFPSSYHIMVKGDQLVLAGVSYYEDSELFIYSRNELKAFAAKLDMDIIEEA